MTFEVNEQEAKKLIHLIGLGNDVINEYRDSKDQKPEYAELTHRLMEQYLQQKTPEFTMCHYGHIFLWTLFVYTLLMLEVKTKTV